jgi:heme A synthase
VNTVVGVVLIGVSISERLTRGRSRWWAGLAVLPLLAAALLAAYVFGEDSYGGGGVRRWDAYRPRAEHWVRCSCFRSGS